jgi:hypothetical protein
LVQIVVDDEHIELPALWYISIDLPYSLDNARLDPRIIDSYAEGRWSCATAMAIRLLSFVMLHAVRWLIDPRNN